MAEAVKDLFPMAKFGIGPAIEDGFYYDFEVGRPFTPEDLEAIEERMRQIVAEEKPFKRTEIDQLEAWDEFEQQPFKRELIAELPEGETISIYRQGAFTDLCRGPHVPDTGRIGAFKLTKIAGAYWRGDNDRPDAAAHLRHRVVHAEGPRRVPRRASRRPRSATTASSARSSTSSASTRWPAPACRSTTPRARACCA